MASLDASSPSYSGRSGGDRSCKSVTVQGQFRVCQKSWGYWLRCLWLISMRISVVCLQALLLSCEAAGAAIASPYPYP
jgi:hypothetical protein